MGEGFARQETFTCKDSSSLISLCGTEKDLGWIDWSTTHTNLSMREKRSETRVPCIAVFISLIKCLLCRVQKIVLEGLNGSLENLKTDNDNLV